MITAMSDINPYSPPQAVTEPEAYRNNDKLMVKAGFKAPRICYKTGVEVNGDVRSLNIVMPKVYDWSLSIYLALFICTVYVIDWKSYPWWVTVLGVISLSLLGEVFKRFTDTFSIYFNKKLRRVYFVRELLRKSIFVIGFVIALAPFESSQDLHLIIGLAIVIISLCMVVKPLKSSSRMGEYAIYRGAHKNFLNAIPEKGSEFTEKFMDS